MTYRACTSRRCDRGIVHLASGSTATCMTCLGTSTVPGVAEQRLLKEAGRLRARSLKDMYDRIEVRTGRRNSDLADVVRDSFNALESEEPHRVPKMFASIQEGRTDAVIDALASYKK